jgi:8-oxo-dGTP diphosphatase
VRVRREYPEAPIIGVGAVVVHDNKVLLVRRGQAPLKGEWSLPGGAVELGETLQQGVVREVLEETGLQVVPIAIIEVLDRITRDEGTGRIQYHYVLVDFACRMTGGTLSGGSDAEDARWVTLEQLQRQAELQVAPVTMRVIEKGFRV